MEEARSGRRLRSRGVAVYELIVQSDGSTRVELTTYSEPETFLDRLRHAFAHRWMRRQTKMALERLRLIFEEPPDAPLKRATHRRLRGVQGAALRRAHRHGPRPPPAPRARAGCRGPQGAAASGLGRACGGGGHRLPRRASRVAALLIVLALTGLSACGNDEEPGVDEPAREGLAIPVDGIQYNVFITRQINPAIQPDVAYYDGPPPAAGSTFYGVFIHACNDTDETHEAIDEFIVKDNQGEEFEPIELPEENVFAYRARELPPGECIPEKGSINQLGPDSASLLMFEMPARRPPRTARSSSSSWAPKRRRRSSWSSRCLSWISRADR